MPLLQSFATDYKVIASSRDQIFGPLKPDLYKYFSNMIQNFLAYQPADMIMRYLSDGNGPMNIFNFLKMDDLIQMLKVPDLPRDDKNLAIARYLESDTPEKKDGYDSETYINLVSHTTFFSDKYEKTGARIGKVDEDAKILLLRLLKNDQLYSDFAPADLPASLQDACKDERLLFVLL